MEDTPMDDTQGELERYQPMGKVVEIPQNYQLQPKGTKKRSSPPRWGQTPSPKKRQKTIFEYAGLGKLEQQSKPPVQEDKEPYEVDRGLEAELTTREHCQTETTAPPTQQTPKEKDDGKGKEVHHRSDALGNREL